MGSKGEKPTQSYVRQTMAQLETSPGEKFALCRMYGELEISRVHMLSTELGSE